MTRSAVAFMAHPDDAEICLGGTLARMAARGWQVHVVVASVPDHRDRRVEEVAAGAAKLGVTAHILDHPGEWQVEDIPGYLLVRQFDEHLRALRPATVFTHWDSDPHHDHVLVARAAAAACRDLSVNLYQCEQANQRAPNPTAFAANTYVDVTDWFDQRLSALACHVSQLSRRDYERHLRARARYYGDRVGCEYAEAFHCVLQRLEP